MLQKEFLGPQKRKEEEMLLSMPRQKTKPKHLEEYEAEGSDDDLKKEIRGSVLKRKKQKLKNKSLKKRIISIPKKKVN